MQGDTGFDHNSLYLMRSPQQFRAEGRITWIIGFINVNQHPGRDGRTRCPGKPQNNLMGKDPGPLLGLGGMLTCIMHDIYAVYGGVGVYPVG
jgi:hypothetical protein